MGKSKKGKSRKLWLKIPLAIILVVFLAVGGYAYSVYHNAKKTVDSRIHEPVSSIDTGKTRGKIKNTEPLNILLMGIDSDSTEGGRSDALMVLTLDPKDEQMQLVSIPRDTRTEIAGKGVEDKINHAYAFGGSDMAVDTVENFLDIELDYYVRINMAGFKQLVDELGTITVNNDVEWSDGKYDFNFGPTEMDGEKTMAFVRMRKQDPDGDFGRTKRQRQVIEGIVNKGASAASVTKLNSLIDVLGKNMGSNMKFSDMKSLLSDYRGARKKFVDYQMKGEGQKIDGIYYLIVDDEEVEKVHDLIVDFGS